MYLISGLLFIACAKDEGMLLMQAPASESPAPEADAQTREGLIQNSDGTWTAVGRRVPLVGAGRFVDNIFPNLVEVLGAKEGLNNITDLNISNTADFSGVGVNLLVGNDIVSVKDMYKTYAAGQQVGFVLGNKANTVLSVDVLKFFVITLYKDNVQVGEPYKLGSADGTTLNLDLVKLTSGGNNGIQTVSIKAEEDFDEVAIGIASGASISASDAAVGIYYAFVGETPIEYITTDDGASIKQNEGWSSDWLFVPGQTPENIITPGENNGVAIPELLVSYSRLTVNFGSMKILSGTELGFTYETGSALDLGILNHLEVTPYDSSWEEIEQDKLETNGVLGLNALSGGEGAYSITATTDRTKGLQFFRSGVGLNVGAMTLKRVYKRDPIVLDPTSYFTAEEEVTVSKTSYRFMTPLQGDDGQVVLSVESGPGTVTGNRVTGLEHGQTTVVKAVYSGNSGTFTTTVTIHCEKSEDADSGITYMTGENYRCCDPAESDAGVALISGINNPENIVDTDITNAATSYTVLDLVNIRSALATIETTNDIVPESGKAIRVGFVLQVNSELLSLSALNFFRVVLYNNGQKVETYIPKSNQSVSLGLLAGSSQVTVSAVTEKAFDHVELQTSGLLSLSLSSLKIYYAYYESVDTDDDFSQTGIRDFCTEVMTPASHGLWLDYDKSDFSLGGLAEIGSAMSDMTNMLDGDMDGTYALIYKTVSAASSTKVSVHFDPIATRQWIGMKISDTESILSAGLLEAVKVNAYYQGSLVGSTDNDFSGLLDLDAISNSDMSYVEVYPTSGSLVDELELEMSGLASVADGLKIYGVYMRPDEDGDGIPDCSEDEKAENDPDSMTAEKNEYHVCSGSGSNLVIGVQGGEIGTEYTMKITGIGGAADDEFPAKLSERREFVITTGEDGRLHVGQYTLDIAPKYATGEVTGYPTDIKVYVHPSETTWSGEKSSDWNDWGNWVEGAPWTCSNVVIPGGRSHYPVLKASDNAVCRYIQFTPGGEVAGTQYLDYEKAWVNVALPNGKYSMFSSPLKETYTGDMFISEYEYTGKVIRADLGAAEGDSVDYSLCWLPLNGSTYPVDRFSPKVYQRAWNRAVQSSGMNGYYDVDLDSEYWTEPYNLVSDPYIAGHGILIRPYEEGKGSGESVFCLPKEYDEYEYYDLVSQTMTGRKDAVERTEKYAGRFIYEDASGNASFPLHVLLENERPSDTYLAGNPFMCHISLKKFFASNPAVYEVKSLKKDGDRYWYETVKKDDESDKKVGPAEGFLVKVGGVYAETSRFRLYIHFTEDMMVTAPQQ